MIPPETFQIKLEDDVFRLSGSLTAAVPSSYWTVVANTHLPRLTIDLSQLTALDLNGASQLLWILKKTRLPSSITGLPADLSTIWELAQKTLPDAPRPVPHEGFLGKTGQLITSINLDLYEMTGFIGELIFHLAQLARRPLSGRWALTFNVAETAGINALPVIIMVAFLVGLILAFQSAMFMKIFGVELYVADLVGISIVRELGALMTAIVLTGRSGSAFSAELGAMKSNQEIDAFLTMGLSPIRDLALPRIMALTIATPLLTILANLAGLIGGNVVMFSLDYPIYVYWNEVFLHLNESDMFTGLFKSLVFGFTVATIGCQRGLAAGVGPGAVGQATTRGVVTNIMVIAFLDSLFAIMFYVLEI